MTGLCSNKLKYCYAYGLVIRSEIDLGLPAISSTIFDVSISFGEVAEQKHNRTFDGVWYDYQNEDQLVLGWQTAGFYMMRHGSEMVIAPHYTTNHDNLRQPILGTGMAMLLHQRGNTVLHGSSVGINGKAWIFLGNKGDGKSTLAAALTRRGCPLLSDDICSLMPSAESGLMMQPSFPRLKLNPDSLIHLGETPGMYSKIHPLAEKRVCGADEEFSATPLPVGGVCVLATGAKSELKRLRAMDAVEELLTHMMVNRFPDHQPALVMATVFKQVTAIGSGVPVYRLTRPRDFNVLSDTADLLYAASVSSKVIEQ